MALLGQMLWAGPHLPCPPPAVWARALEPDGLLSSSGSFSLLFLLRCPPRAVGTQPQQGVLWVGHPLEAEEVQGGVNAFLPLKRQLCGAFLRLPGWTGPSLQAAVAPALSVGFSPRAPSLALESLIPSKETTCIQVLILTSGFGRSRTKLHANYFLVVVFLVERKSIFNVYES